MAWVPQEVDTSPGQRFRMEQWAPHLRKAGIEIIFEPFSDARASALLKIQGHLPQKAWSLARGLAARVRSGWKAGAFDAAYVFREGALLGPALPERILAWSGVPFVFDFDDAVWLRYVSPANSYLSYLRFSGKTSTICRMARHVLVGNAYLAKYARERNRNVTIVPTTIDTDAYRERAEPRNGMPTITWTGSYSTEQYLALVRKPLERLRRRHAFRLVVIGGGTFEASGVEVEHRPWRSSTEVADLGDASIGLMPLPDASWERGKCGLKALQYMALGVPAVVSPVGCNSEIVTHGANGLLASSEAEWEAALERLLMDHPLRVEMGRAARRTVEKEYSAAVHAPRVAKIFHELAR